MAVPNYDVVLQQNDLYISEYGDFMIGESDEQHIADTINAFPGWWKENPADGVGILAYLNSAGQEQELARSIKIQLQSDGYKVDNPEIFYENGVLNVNPNATKV